MESIDNINDSESCEQLSIAVLILAGGEIVILVGVLIYFLMVY